MKTQRMIEMKPQHTSFLIKPPGSDARLRRLPLAALTLILVSSLSLSGCPGSDSSDGSPSDPGDTSPPEFQSAVVNGATLAVTFNETLGNVPPDSSELQMRFVVMVGPSATATQSEVSSVSDGMPDDPTLELTLAMPVAHGDVVTLAYTAGTALPISDVAGNPLADFGPEDVRNPTPLPGDTDAPVFQSAMVNGATLTITFNENLNFPLPTGLGADFTVRVTPTGGTEAERSVNSVSDDTLGDPMIELTLETAVIRTDRVTVEYTANNSRRITDLSGNILASFAARRIQNNTAAIPTPDDTDGDGVLNAADNCPDNANPLQEDTDGDNVGNICDNCPDNANLLQEDDDNDDVGNICDNCRDVSNPDQVNSDGDDVGNACDTDDDNDTELDTTDVDDDGDGLIEIHDLNMLDNVRNNLSGSAYNDGGSDDRTGCGGLNAITFCSGYELSRDLSFAEADSYADNMINLAWRPNANADATSAEVEPENGVNPGWLPIGDNSRIMEGSASRRRFATIFEGNGHTITGLYTRVEPASGAAYASLFGFMNSSGTIRNVGMVAAAVFAFSSNNVAHAGGLVGSNNSGNISNSYATGSVSDTSTSAFSANVGGLVGFNSGSISNSYATASVSTSSSNATVGGLVGSNSSFGTISDSYATGSVSVSVTGNANAGGLVGGNQGNISNSYATGSVSVTVTSLAYVGGLVGNNTGSISNSYATGSVSTSASGLDTNVGGLVGWNQDGSSISNSYATGSVSVLASGGVVAGGLVGENRASISNSYATGSVSALTTSTISVSAGGLVGQQQSVGSSISNSYATGSVSASGSTAAAGGLVGDNNGSISNSYWDRATALLKENGMAVSTEDQDTGNTGDHSGVTALSSSQMQAIMEATGMTGTFPALSANGFDLGTSSEYPLVEYAEIAAYCADSAHTTQTACQAAFKIWLAAEAECEFIAANTAANDGDLNMPDCGDLLPGQAVRMASGFLRFSNTAIGTPSSTDFVFFYDIEDAAASIAISGTGVNGTTAGSYAIEDAAGTALTGYSFSATSGNSTITLPTLSDGAEFYLKVSFTKGSDSFMQRYRFKK